MLLEKTWEALAPGGALIIHEAIIDDERRKNTFGLLMSLNMLIETPGEFDFTGADCIGWMGEAGFKDAYVEALTGPNFFSFPFPGVYCYINRPPSPGARHGGPMLKKIMIVLFIASLIFTAGVAARRAMAGDNGEALGHCKGKAQGNAIGHNDCNNACTDLCSVALAGATYSCNASFDPSVCDPADLACIANIEALLSQCLSEANATYNECVASCN